eukprot:c12352_g1_i2.p1 GENE.c12352_g1_i2~~c12352_g1_i2.p1  ORF type:complete len:354 (+),score=77.71 c12352_g1_i2:22-1062(+)
MRQQTIAKAEAWLADLPASAPSKPGSARLEQLLQHALKLSYGMDSGIRIDHDQATDILLNLSRQGHCIATAFLGNLLRKIGRKDLARKTFSRAMALNLTGLAEAGDPLALVVFGLATQFGFGTPKNIELAVELYAKSASKNNSIGEGALGYMYDTGTGVAQNNDLAILLYRRSAIKGNAVTQCNLGCVMRELGRPESDEEAIWWFSLAAEQGEIDAECSLGWMMEHGRGTPRNIQRGVYWYERGALHNDPIAQNNLAHMYEYGLGVQQNLTTAVFWYRESAGQGDATAQTNLAFMYEQGRGVEKDILKAISWYKLAAAQGNVRAKHSLSRLARSEAEAIDLIDADS